MANTTIDSFSGVNLRDESTALAGQPSSPMRRANNAYLFPRGALARPPTYQRLWGMLNLKSFLPALGLSAVDLTVLLLIRNEGQLYLAFYDCQNLQTLGGFYAGLDPESEFVGTPTLTAANPTIDVLWTGLAPQQRWNGERSGYLTVMGNGFDPNLTFESNTLTIRKMGDSVRPLQPVVSAVDVRLTTAKDATLQVNNVTFTALEPGFRPLHDPPYRRDRGNFVQVSVVRGGYTTFSSELTGLGVTYSPFIYTVITPETLPTEDQLVNFIQRDPNAQGILNAELSGAPGPCRLFPPASLSGATAEFLATDAFAGPHVAVCVTYLKKLEGDFVRETMPSPVGICPINAGFRVAVTVTRDTVSAFAADYDAMRIYIADLASPLFNISPEYYGSFYRVIDVPNATGTYEITPSMQDASTILSTEARIPPPCSMFILANSRITMSGNAAFPMRYWFTKQISTHEPLPEGLGIYDYINLPAETVNDAIVALGEYRGQGVAYTKTNAYPLETGTITHFAVKYGAVNSAVIANWSNGAQYFLARDYNIYTLTQPVTDAKADLPDFNLPLPQISDYIQRFCDTTDSQFAHSIVDALNKNWWLWLKGAAGNMQSFCINMETAELTGPFDFPQFISATYFQNGDTKLVGQDMAGNLFVMDFAQTLDTSERYDNDSGITLHPPTDAADPTMDGYGIAIVPDANGNPQYVERAQIMRVQTPWNNCGDPDLRKGFYSVEWQVVDGSSGLVTIVAINEKGQQVSRYYGDVFGKNQPHRVLMRLKGNQLQFMLIVIVGDNKPFALRNITVNYEPLGPT